MIPWSVATCLVPEPASGTVGMSACGDCQPQGPSSHHELKAAAALQGIKPVLTAPKEMLHFQQGTRGARESMSMN